jgi:hypothetical protein
MYVSGVFFILKVGVEESIVNASRITDHLTSLIALFVLLLCRLTSGTFTIDSSTPTLRINLLTRYYDIVLNIFLFFFKSSTYLDNQIHLHSNMIRLLEDYVHNVSIFFSILLILRSASVPRVFHFYHLLFEPFS